MPLTRLNIPAFGGVSSGDPVTAPRAAEGGGQSMHRAVGASFAGAALLAAALSAWAIGCGAPGAPASSAARSRHAFDWIQRQVGGRTEAEVERLLGKPDSREPRLADDEVWIWWNYTFLDGEQYPPEVRGQVVHLEITFDRPPGLPGRDAPHAAWRVAGPLSVSFSRKLPGS
jgi:hypothetical protein